MVNRHQFDCSICPTEDPSTWTGSDLDFEVTCGEEERTLSFQLDNLLEVNWLQEVSVELAYTTSSQGQFRDLITSVEGFQKRTITDLVQICLNFKQDTSIKQAICGYCGTTTTTTTTTNGKYHIIPLPVWGLYCFVSWRVAHYSFGSAQLPGLRACFHCLIKTLTLISRSFVRRKKER